MNRQEFSLFANGIKTFYPKEKLIVGTEAMELWYQMLQDIPYDVAVAALKKWVSLNKWSPSVADIRELSVGVKGVTVNEWEEEWDKVTDAIAKYGYYRTEEALETLPELTRTIVKRLGFRNLCMSENISIERANFRDIYNREAEKVKQQNVLSESLKSEILSISQSTVKAIEG
jgi:hypothetical protein